MITVLIVIYLVFISLGLPDSVFGAIWPVVHVEFATPQSLASFYSIITGLSSGLSSFFAGPLIRKLGTPLVTVISVLLTVVGLIGISCSNSFVMLIAFAVVMGFGAGAIDTGLNNYVSLHYKASHMSWLHCFWGVGVTLSPAILSYFLKPENAGWRSGVRSIALIQAVIAVVALAFLPRWRKFDKVGNAVEIAQTTKKKGKPPIFSKPGFVSSVLSMGFYTAMEFIISTWGATYFVNVFAVDAAKASGWLSFYFAGVMAGRFLSGFAAMKFKDDNLIRFGIAFSFVGMILLTLQLSISPYIGFLLIGLGFAPVFPSIVHRVPFRFGTEFSADYTGFTMSGGYAIGYCISLLFGFVASNTSFLLTPFVLICLACLVIVFNETAVNKSKTKSGTQPLTED